MCMCTFCPVYECWYNVITSQWYIVFMIKCTFNTVSCISIVVFMVKIMLFCIPVPCILSQLLFLLLLLPPFGKHILYVEPYIMFFYFFFYSLTFAPTLRDNLTLRIWISLVRFCANPQGLSESTPCLFVCNSFRVYLPSYTPSWEAVTSSIPFNQTLGIF